MKKIFTYFMVVCLALVFCGCRESQVETSYFSNYENSNVTTENENNNESDANEGQNTNKNENNNESDANEGQNTNKNESKDGSSGGNKISAEDAVKINLNGAQISIYSTEHSFTPDATASKSGKKHAEMLQELQRKINCKISVKEVEQDKLNTYMTTAAASGKALCSLIETNAYSAGFYLTTNLVADLSKISSIDLSADYMQRFNMHKATTFGKGVYGVAGDGEQTIFTVFFNKRILKEIGYEDSYIYDLVDSGKWNISNYRAIAKKAMKDLDGKSGMTAADQWGQSVIDGPAALTANTLSSFGTGMITSDSAGKLVYNMENPEVITCLNTVYDMLVKDNTNVSRIEETVEQQTKHFISGKSLFFYAPVFYASKLANMNDEYGMVPAPKMDGAKNYASAVDWNSGVLMIPAGLSAKDQKNAGAFLQAFESMYQSDVINAITSEYENRYFCDTKSTKMMATALKQATLQQTQIFAQIDTDVLAGTYRVFWDYIDGKTTSPVTAIEATKSSTKALIEDFNKKIK